MKIFAYMFAATAVLIIIISLITGLQIMYNILFEYKIMVDAYNEQVISRAKFLLPLSLIIGPIFGIIFYFSNKN